MASSQRGTWSYSQTETLLDVLIDQQTLNELDSRPTRHDVIYADLAPHLSVTNVPEAPYLSVTNVPEERS